MGRYAGKFGKKRRIPLVSWVMILAAVLSLLVGGVVAYLSTSTGAVINIFTADESTDPQVMEEFDESVKQNVYVNVGDNSSGGEDKGYAVYVRAAVVVTWKDKKDGNVLGTIPAAGTDYTINYNTTDWFQGADGFWYHKTAVASAGDTAVLIESCTAVEEKTPEGYGLNVEIIAQTIQAIGTTDAGETPAVTDAWGVYVDDNKMLTLTPP